MKSFLPLLFILISMSGISQIRINSESHENIQRLISQSKEKTHLELKSDNPLLPIYKVNGELCLSTLAKVSPNFNVSDLMNDNSGSMMNNSLSSISLLHAIIGIGVVSVIKRKKQI